MAPTIVPSIAEAVEESLSVRHPKHFARLGRLSIISRVIVDSKMRHAPVPEVFEGGDSAVPTTGPGSIQMPDIRPSEDAAERARRRIVAMRGDF